MKRVPAHFTNQLALEGIHAYMERTVTKYGNGAKVDCPKAYLGRRVILVIL